MQSFWDGQRLNEALGKRIFFEKNMRLFNLSIRTVFLLVVLVFIQLGLWFGEGGWIDAMQKRGNLAEVERKLFEDEQLLLKLGAEVKDLKEGSKSIEERARFEHGMIERDEIFFQLTH